VPVVPVGVAADGSMEVPENVATAGWYRFGPAPGEQHGSVVLSGHINDRDQGVGAFAVLADVAEGEPVRVTMADGRVLDYRVVARERFDKSVVPMGRIFDRSGAPRLTLVTCGGAFDRASGNYRDNIVVTAVPD
jgi:sortase (surface protein transpeptidase)